MRFFIIFVAVCGLTHAAVLEKRVLARPQVPDDQDPEYTQADDAGDEDPEDYPDEPNKILSPAKNFIQNLGDTVKLPCRIEASHTATSEPLRKCKLCKEQSPVQIGQQNGSPSCREKGPFAEAGEDHQCSQPQITYVGEDVVVRWTRGRKQEVPLFLGSIKQLRGDTRYELDTQDHTLTITNIQPEDSGPFTCELPGEANVTHTLTIKSGLSINITPDKDFVGKDGEPITFACQATGTTEPLEVHWIEHNYDGELRHNSNELSIKKLTWRHNGTYTCVAKTAQGETVSKTVTMIVSAPPVVKAEAKEVNSAETMMSEMVCNVNYCSKSTCQVLWKKDGENKALTRDRHYDLYQHGAKYTLRISATKSKDFGRYSCVVRNEFGNTTEHIELTEKPLKPVLMTQKGLVLSWKTVSKTNLIEYEVWHKKPQDDDWVMKTVKVDEGQNGIVTLNHTFEIKDQMGSYSAKIRVKNDKGYSPESNEVPFAAGGSETVTDSLNVLESSKDPNAASHMELRVSLALILSLLTSYLLH